MTNLPKVLLCSLIAAVVAATAIGGTVLSVEYHPEGVKPHQREIYAKRQRKIARLEQLAKTMESEVKPIAVASNTEFDFGMVDPHATLTHDFSIQNQGDAPLELNVAKTSCKCTMGDLEKDVLLPGETTNVTMTWNTGYQAEEYKQTAIVVTNDPLRSSITFKVQGEVKAKFVAPEQIAFNKTDPGVPTEARFLVFSQLWEDFLITDIQCDIPGFEWHAEPSQVDVATLADSEARSAWEVRVFSAPWETGDYKAKLKLTVVPNDGGEEVTRDMVCFGKVRKTINFYSPDIHQTNGLDIGILVSGKKHQFNVVVRTRNDVNRKIEVLDVEPKELQAELKSLSTPGSYRLTLTVPPDCPMVVFNTLQKQGYVHVGDPTNKSFSNWFPVTGAVVTLDQ
ncbi:MAG: DUF1573 domain-containing protein [Rubripirellula sp.]|nr:DUF1573 domain-containing protein [Rubripirellula sp.]